MIKNYGFRKSFVWGYVLWFSIFTLKFSKFGIELTIRKSYSLLWKHKVLFDFYNFEIDIYHQKEAY